MTKEEKEDMASSNSNSNRSEGETGSGKKMNWINSMSTAAMIKMENNPVKTAVIAAVAGDQISSRVATPALNWVGDKFGSLFTSGAEAAVEEAVEEEAVAASVGSLLGGVGKVLGSAFKNVVD